MSSTEICEHQGGTTPDVNKSLEALTQGLSTEDIVWACFKQEVEHASLCQVVSHTSWRRVDISLHSSYCIWGYSLSFLWCFRIFSRYLIVCVSTQRLCSRWERGGRSKNFLDSASYLSYCLSASLSTLSFCCSTAVTLPSKHSLALQVVLHTNTQVETSNLQLDGKGRRKRDFHVAACGAASILFSGEHISGILTDSISGEGCPLQASFSCTMASRGFGG